MEQLANALILHMRKLRPRQVTSLTQSHTLGQNCIEQALILCSQLSRPSSWGVDALWPLDSQGPFL